MNKQPKLAGRRALVTGASKGIGAAIARQLAAEGAAVAVNYSSDQAGAERVVAGIRAAGGTALAVHGNVADPADAARMVEETVRAFGGIDLLVNNAGVYQFAPIEEITPEFFHRQFDINVLGLLLVTQAAVKRFPETGGGVINISSLISTYGMPGGAVYAGTKGAVDSATRALAKELGPRGIRINTINPGVVATEGTATAGIQGSEFEKEIAAQTPLGRTGAPQDIASAALFLASDDSSWITGESFFISGGFR